MIFGSFCYVRLAKNDNCIVYLGIAASYNSKIDPCYTM